jgi:transposase-like protein
MSGIRFTDEFKRDAVAQVVDRRMTEKSQTPDLTITRGCSHPSLRYLFCVP